MKLQKYSHYLQNITPIISSALLLTVILPTQLLAQTAPLKLSVNFPSGDSKGAPETTAGGGKRGITSCIALDGKKPTLTAVMPTRENKSLTVSKSPHFFVYIPETTANQGEFLLRSGEDDIYQTSFKLPKKSGIVRLKLPKTVLLDTGKTYTWFFTIVCNEDDRSADEYTEGLIKRTAITPSVNRAVKQAPPLKQAKIYAQYNMWPETISKVAALRQEKPQEWKQLLQSVGLEIIAEEPLLPVELLPTQP